MYAVLLSLDTSYLNLGNTLLVGLPAIIAAIATLITSIRNGKKTDDLHDKVNGRLQELLNKTREEAFAQGRLAGKEEIIKNGQIGIPAMEDPRQLKLPTTNGV